MKTFSRYFLSFALLLAFTGTHAEPYRIIGRGEELTDVHAMGNGKLCAYARRADIYQIFGNPYSAPSMLGMFLNDRTLTSESERVPDAAAWKHRISGGEGEVSTICDFVSYSGNSLVRRINASKEFVLNFGACFESGYIQYADMMHFEEISLEGFKTAWLVTIDAGVPFYSRYKSPGGYQYIVATKGNASIASYDSETKMTDIVVSKGKSEIYVMSGRTVEELEANAVILRKMTASKLQRECIRTWKKYSRPQHGLRFPNMDRQDRNELAKAIDNVGILLKTQQGEEGGVLAGIVYHMVYVRDHYGVSRSFLALGHTEEARKVLDFYYGIYQKHGYIKNAQSEGWDGIFHCHENDETEITGYLIVQAFDYLEKSGDIEFIKRIMPMLEWAAEAQQRNIVDGMLPFNGDEIYIAGGQVPRSVMFHGSAEATLLFVEGCNKLLAFVEENGLWNQEKIDSLRADVETCSSSWRENFFYNGKLYINNPEREKHVEYPPKRPGVCLYPGALDHYPETYHYEGSLYFCKDCMAKDKSGIEVPEPARYSIPSASLFPFYINSTLLADEEKEGLLNEVVELYMSTGKISSQPSILGYDYGMFLYALVKTGNPLASEVYSKMMGMRDKAGAWVEYYLEGKPMGCPCRPWESGIDIEAAIEFAKSPLSSGNSR